MVVYTLKSARGTAVCSYPYITLVLNFSQTWALYCLIQFYAQTHEELKSINPLAKFICFKSIVFATWWQGVVISLVFGSGWVQLGPDELSGGKFQTFLQDFLVCLEVAWFQFSQSFQSEANGKGLRMSCRLAELVFSFDIAFLASDFWNLWWAESSFKVKARSDLCCISTK